MLDGGNVGRTHCKHEALARALSIEKGEKQTEVVCSLTSQDVIKVYSS